MNLPQVLNADLYAGSRYLTAVAVTIDVFANPYSQPPEPPGPWSYEPPWLGMWGGSFTMHTAPPFGGELSLIFPGGDRVRIAALDCQPIGEDFHVKFSGCGIPPQQVADAAKAGA